MRQGPTMQNCTGGETASKHDDEGLCEVMQNLVFSGFLPCMGTVDKNVSLYSCIYTVHAEL